MMMIKQALQNLNIGYSGLAVYDVGVETLNGFVEAGVYIDGVFAERQAEITAEVTRLQAEYDANQYQRDRATAYPSLQDQADMAYWDRKNGTTTLDDAISAVKAEFPKG